MLDSGFKMQVPGYWMQDYFAARKLLLTK